MVCFGFLIMAKNRYDELFAIEMEGWCYGLTNYPGEIFPELVHGVVRELKPSFLKAIQMEVIFDVVKIAQQFSKAAKYLVPEKEIVFSMLAQFPPPQTLKTEDEMYVMAQILDKVEQAHQGAIERLERRWKSGDAETKPAR